jgi:hypothetical protein
MSNAATALSVPGSVPAVLRPIEAGFAGLLWVLFNLLLVWLGAKSQHPGSCSIAAGGVNGAVLSIIAVTKVSARLRSGATGLLGGISASAFDKDANLLTKWANSIHVFVDHLMTALSVAGDEKWHDQVESAIVWIVWVTILVVLMSLVAEWASASWRESLTSPSEHR